MHKSAAVIHFATYTAEETLNAFQWVGQPPIIAPSRGYLDLHLTHVFIPFWAYENQLPQTAFMILIGSAVFAQYISVTNNTQTDTHRHTDHATYDICRNRPHLYYAMRPNNNNKRRR